MYIQIQPDLPDVTVNGPKPSIAFSSMKFLDMQSPSLRIFRYCKRCVNF
jgi:hypothetical protein